MNVEGHKNPLKLLFVLLLHHDLPLVVHDPVSTRGVRHPPLDPNRAAVHVRLVGELPDIGQPHLHNGAGLVSPDEGLVGAAPAGDPGTASEGEHDGSEDG